ncbi:MAG TPA: alpha/beta fold hydrolase [Pyrinomonadaceae bacterium]|nr:alpha/beta fold hydrolase [Pyrinomonadaceae bacterium]
MTIQVSNPLGVEPVRRFLSKVERAFADRPFTPHPLFKGGHVQTLAAYAWPRRGRLRAPADEKRLFQVTNDTQVLAHCRWQTTPADHPTVVVWHGIEGSSEGVYMLATARKAFAAGFNVVRMNLRNCGETEHLTPTLYHGGLTEDLRAVVAELIESDKLNRVFLIGFSLGGNMVLKLAGEYGESPPPEILGVCAVSPSVDLNASAELILRKSNWLYHQDFLRRLKGRLLRKQKLFPNHYDTSAIRSVRTLREFDDIYTSRAHGFKGAADYYYRASSIRVVDKIRLPTLIIHGKDDPFIPFAPLRDPKFATNPYILLLAPPQGGHVAFVGSGTDREDRFWAENRVVEFCKLAVAEFGAA